MIPTYWASAQGWKACKEAGASSFDRFIMSYADVNTLPNRTVILIVGDQPLWLHNRGGQLTFRCAKVKP